MRTFKVDGALEYIRELQGYKLSDIHFRIGRKYHTNTFVHAKVLLHNSFYTSRIALRIAIELGSVLTKNQPVTLVGYERYSELLLGLVTHFLNAMFPDLSISSCILVDGDDQLSLFGSRELHQDYVVIVPIVSTATTTKRMISTYKRKTGFDREPLHIFHIIHLRPNDQSTQLLLTPKPSTFISEDLEWYEPYECKKCFDEKQSQALLEADQSNLNPIVIFGKPSVKTVYRIGDSGEDLPSFVGCHFRDANFEESLVYLQDNNSRGLRTYSHKTDVFINENRRRIEEWLKKVKEDDHFQIKPTDRVVILSPCQNNETNMPFVNLVNEKVFDSSATIIYHEADREYPENFSLLNYDFLKKEVIEAKENQLKVFYVDDDLVSGHSFFTIYDLFRYSTDYDSSFTMTGAIFLMNKASANLNKRVTRASKRVHSFIAVNIPQYYSVRQRGPFELEIQRYAAIEKHTISYEQERYFHNKRVRLEPQRSHEPEDKEKKDLHLQMFLATNALFEIFANEDFQSMSFDVLCNKCELYDDRITDPFAIIRVLTRATFTMFRPLKEKIFEWVKDLLPSYEESLIKWMTYVEPKRKPEKRGKTKKEPKEEGSLFKDREDVTQQFNRHLMTSDLDHFEDLIRRAALIGNYRIIQEEFFLFLDRIFVESEKQTRVDVGNFEKKLRSHYCELIHKNTACVYPLYSHLKNVTFSSNRGQLFQKCVLNEAVAVVGYLYDEMVSSGFHEHIQEELDKKAEKERKGKEMADVVRKAVDEWKNKAELKNSIEIANSVLKVTKGAKESFFDYCYLKHLFYSDANRKDPRHENVKEILDDIFAYCKKLIGNEEGVGAFLAVFDIAGDLRLVYDRNESGSAILRNKIRQNDFQSYLRDLDKDLENPVVKSIHDGCASASDMSFLMKFGKQYKYLELLHIGSVEEKKTYGIVGFYAKTNFIDSIGRGYLMLLRRDFLSFIALHHKNDEFVAQLLAENKKRFEYLSGHGRETIQKLATTYKDVYERVVSTMERVQGIFLVNDSTNEVNVELFDRYFGPDVLMTALNDDFKERLKRMATNIYKGSNVIEWDEEVPEIDVDLCKVNSFKGRFSIRLLEFISFELMINAKKNRFIKTDAFNDIYKQTSFRGNSFNLVIMPEEDQLVIRASGTGHRVWDTTIERIKGNAEIKENNDISGLDLIIQLITTFDNRNIIEITSERKDGPVYINTMSVFIKYRLI